MQWSSGVMLNCLFMQFLVLQAKLSKKCVEKVLVVSAARSEYLQCMTASAAWRLLAPPGTGPLSIDVTRLRSALGWGGAAAAALPWPPLVTSPDIWLHNWDNNSSGGKHLIKTLCSIWTAELFTQLEGKQGWTMDIERFRVYSVDKYLFALYNIFIIFLDIYYRLI